MSPFAAVAVKSIGAAGVAALLSMGVVSAATPQPSTNAHPERQAVRRAVLESEADVLGISAQTLAKDLKAGQKVSDLAKDKGVTEQQFADKLVASLRPRLAKLVEAKVITQAQADKLIDRISKGHVPFWDGRHLRK
jgi:uncharacterized protein YaiL (DUF2058 family)